MKNYHVSVITIILLVSLSIVTSCSGIKYLEKSEHAINSANLTLKLEIDKDIFNASENIKGTLIFTNLDTNEFFINTRFYCRLEEHSAKKREIYIEIYKDNERYQPFTYTFQNASWVKKQHFKIIEPNQMISCYVYVWDSYVPLEKGHYKACAVYENYYTMKTKKCKTFTGLIKSNFVSFEIE
ncbi:MAG TPA: hypothetical protein PLP19_04780 [bacterium]|nr:hypothetical protein [bacterium]HPN42786.1 hypothetical protein [bacterium]